MAKKNMETEERIEVFVPKAMSRDDINLFVSVNGVNYLLPRGKKSLVPKAVAAEIERAREAQEQQDARIESLLKK